MNETTTHHALTLTIPTRLDAALRAAHAGVEAAYATEAAWSSAHPATLRSGWSEDEHRTYSAQCVALSDSTQAAKAARRMIWRAVKVAADAPTTTPAWYCPEWLAGA